jgi:hypothetical protein
VDVAVSWTLVQQCDPEALALWNHYAEDNKNQDVLQQLIRIFQQDFPTFCGMLLKVRPKGGGYTTEFLWNQVQRRMWREMCDAINAGKPPWFVILKFRQAGMSTFWCAWLFWQMWRQTNLQTMVVAHQLPTAETMIETMRVFYDELPEMFRPDLREGNHGASIPRGEVYFADRRSYCLIHLAKNMDPRGQQVTHVLETESAMYPNSTELNGALLPQLPTFGSEAILRSSVIIESTPKGQNEFHDMYMDAKNGRFEPFTAVFFPWFLFEEQYCATAPQEFKLNNEEKSLQKKLTRIRMHEYEERDGGGVPVTREQMYWRRMTINTQFRGDEARFRQEYPEDDISCWMLSSKSVFKQYSDFLGECIHEAPELAKEIWSKQMVNGHPVITNGPARIILHPKVEIRGSFTPITHVDFEVHAHGKWLVWAPPVDGHKYVVGADPALGLEDGDNSCICVVDVTAGRQVAEFTDTMPPERFAIEIAAACYWYNTALATPEINAIGSVVLKRLTSNIQYPYMYKWPKWDEGNKFSNKKGWETNPRSKQILVSGMIYQCEEQTIRIASKELYAEMSTFERKENTYLDGFTFNAQKGRYDDRVMAFGLCVMAIEQTPILMVELSKNRHRIPSARDLHLASSAADGPANTVLPKKIAELVAIKYQGSWNPFNSEMPL